MKQIVFPFLFFYMVYLNLHCQNDILTRDSLSVFVVVNKDIANILDSFIVNAEYSNYYPLAVFIMYVDLYDNGDLSLVLDLRKQEKYSDSIILYKHSYFYQAFISHQNILFQVNFMTYFEIKNYYKLTELLKIQQKKQLVYFKKPPPDFYDTSRKGEIDYKDMLKTWGYEYYNEQWHNIIKINYVDDN
jgi:hypothetical protein